MPPLLLNVDISSPDTSGPVDASEIHHVSLSCNLVAACMYFALKGDVFHCLSLSNWYSMFLHIFSWLVFGFELYDGSVAVESPLANKVQAPQS